MEQAHPSLGSSALSSMFFCSFTKVRTALFLALALCVHFLCSLARWFWLFLPRFWGWCLFFSTMTRFSLAEPQSQLHLLRIISRASWWFIESLLEASYFVPTKGPLGVCSVVTLKRSIFISQVLPPPREEEVDICFTCVCVADKGISEKIQSYFLSSLKKAKSYQVSCWAQWDFLVQVLVCWHVA